MTEGNDSRCAVKRGLKSKGGKDLARSVASGRGDLDTVLGSEPAFCFRSERAVTNPLRAFLLAVWSSRTRAFINLRRILLRHLRQLREKGDSETVRSLDLSARRTFAGTFAVVGNFSPISRTVSAPLFF